MDLRVGTGGEIALPGHLRERYGLAPNTCVRIIETRSGILLIPLADLGLDPQLEEELAEWQDLGVAGWDLFPYDESRE